MFMGTFSSILGAIILISIVLPWFLIGVFVIFLGYVYAATFYCASARELKRLGKLRLGPHTEQLLTARARCRAEVIAILTLLGKSVGSRYYPGLWGSRAVPPR